MGCGPSYPDDRINYSIHESVNYLNQEYTIEHLISLSEEILYKKKTLRKVLNLSSGWMTKERRNLTWLDILGNIKEYPRAREMIINSDQFCPIILVTAQDSDDVLDVLYGQYTLCKFWLNQDISSIRCFAVKRVNLLDN
jgi:hypothetical protein